MVGSQDRRREASISHVQKVPGDFRGFGRAPLHYGKAESIQSDGNLLGSFFVRQEQQQD